jgi:hypothetical protein
MPFTKLAKSRSGQSRILEAVIAAVIIFIVFSVSLYLIRASDVKVRQEKADLDRLGYNVLHTLVESGTIDQTLEDSPQPWIGQAYLKSSIQNALPASMYFNLTIYNCTGSLTGPWFEPDTSHVTNAPDGAFAQAMEVSSTSLTYTSKNGNIYYLVLVLTRAGGG